MTISKEFVPLFKSIDLSVRRLPIFVIDSGEPGPVIGITAAIHGDEVTGTAVVQSLVKRLSASPLKKGKIFALPILNPTGFETVTRSLLYDGADLNRSFDGDNIGSPAERSASIILSTVLKFSPDFVIDLHTDSSNSIAYTLVDQPNDLSSKKVVESSIKLAQELGFPWAIDTEESASYPLEKCLTGQLVSRGIPAVTIELGGPLVVVEPFRQAGLEAIWQILYSRNLVATPPKKFDDKKQTSVLTFQSRIRTTSTGIIDYRVQPGQVIKAKQILGIVRDVFGETIETIYSPVSGILFSHEDQSVVFPGLSLFTLATEKR